MTNPTDGHPTTTSDRPRLPRRRRVPLRTHLPLSAESGFVCLPRARCARRGAPSTMRACASIRLHRVSRRRLVAVLDIEAAVKMRGIGCGDSRAGGMRRAGRRPMCARGGGRRTCGPYGSRSRSRRLRCAVSARSLHGAASRCRFAVPLRRTASPRAPRSVGSTRRFAVPPRCIDAPYRHAATARRRRLHRFPASARHAAPMRSLTPPSCRFAARRSRSST